MKNSHHILVVDDDKAIRDEVAEILEEEGYIVESFANGDAALKHLKQIKPEVLPRCIILDLMMPVLKGSDFIAELKTIPALSEVNIIIVTATGNADDLINNEGLKDFFKIRKPFDLEELLQLVDCCCKKVRN